MLSSEELPIVLERGFQADRLLQQVLNFEAPLPQWKFSTDSRRVALDGWFIALKGSNFNGHQFCQQALKSGATGLIVSELPDELAKAQVPILLVSNTLEAYQLIARHHRRKHNSTIIALTGSNGKTSTKEMLQKVLSVKLTTSCSEGNENNEIGVPKNILKIESSTQAFIAECGMRGLHQIEDLSKICEADCAAITNIGTAHIGLLGSRENIAQAKCEIFRFMPKDKTAFIPHNEPLIEPWEKSMQGQINFVKFGQYENAHFDGQYMRFTYKNFSYALQTPNVAFVSNACLVIEIAHHLGLSSSQIQEGLLAFKPFGGRGQIHQLTGGALVIDETYNANPDSALALAQSLQAFGHKYHKILILGEMAELGDFAGFLLDELASKLHSMVDTVLLIGEANRSLADKLGENAHWVTNLEDAHSLLKDNAGTMLNSGCIIGLKASRSAQLERLLTLLQDES